jgi:hypothetical protein
MAKGHPRNAGYQPGNYWDTCERCGFERRADELQEEWTGLTVCADTCWEPRHEQDFLRANEERPGTSGTQDGTDNNADATATAAMAANRTGSDYTVPSGDNDNEL